jgi:hypothetical protein
MFAACCPDDMATRPGLLGVVPRARGKSFRVVLVTGSGSIESLGARGDEVLGQSAEWELVRLPLASAEIHAYGEGAVLIPRTTIGPAGGDSTVVRAWDAYPVEGEAVRLCLGARLARHPAGPVLRFVTMAPPPDGSPADPPLAFWNLPGPSAHSSGPCSG